MRIWFKIQHYFFLTCCLTRFKSSTSVQWSKTKSYFFRSNIWRHKNESNSISTAVSHNIEIPDNQNTDITLLSIVCDVLSKFLISTQPLHFTLLSSDCKQTVSLNLINPNNIYQCFDKYDIKSSVRHTLGILWRVIHIVGIKSTMK